MSCNIWTFSYLVKSYIPVVEVVFQSTFQDNLEGARFTQFCMVFIGLHQIRPPITVSSSSFNGKLAEDSILYAAVGLPREFVSRAILYIPK